MFIAALFTAARSVYQQMGRYTKYGLSINGVLLSLKEGKSDTCSNMDKPGKHAK